ncbi:retropepsin-like aspartic protease family protein [Pseudaestuariivita atlantica]|uniref:Aspartyl protease n=1 Tax=Pseudaestuariivita atlantica TaxID=1317121 RepID=A0A0L1JMA7_9RHOB|nr:TIGR02281 family clan AA aspartic protease [Pseudaestuariivita atlantica]KNG92891.1 aspartyl protease [Pseudaestuariivita atlantica]
MDGDDIARLVYLGLFATVIAGALLLQMRHRMSELARGAAIWVLIFLGAILAVGLWEDIRGTVSPRAAVNQSDGTITIPRAPDGHYYATLDVNGAPVTFVVDTGATGIVLSREDAERAGIDVDGLAFLGQAATANGTVAIAPVRLDSIAFGPIEDRNLSASVNGGELDQSLLGMTYLQRYARIEIEGGKLVLTR